jgi:hypothetical protein
MNEIIQRLIDKTGIPEDKATIAVDTVVNFLKEKLPAPLAGQLDGLMIGAPSENAGVMAAGVGALGVYLARRKRNSGKVGKR